MTRQQTWFTKQLETAAQEAKDLPSWARQEAGLRVLSSDESSTRESHASSPNVPAEVLCPTQTPNK